MSGNTHPDARQYGRLPPVISLTPAAQNTHHECTPPKMRSMNSPPLDSTQYTIMNHNHNNNNNNNNTININNAKLPTACVLSPNDAMAYARVSHELSTSAGLSISDVYTIMEASTTNSSHGGVVLQQQQDEVHLVAQPHPNHAAAAARMNGHFHTPSPPSKGWLNASHHSNHNHNNNDDHGDKNKNNINNGCTAAAASRLECHVERSGRREVRKEVIPLRSAAALWAVHSLLLQEA